MSHVGDIRAKATDHAVVRYADRVLGLTVEDGTPDDEAVRDLRRRGLDVGRVRRRLCEVGGILMSAMARQAKAEARTIKSGRVLAFPEGCLFVVNDGAVVTVLGKTMRPGALKPTGPSMPVRQRTCLDAELAQ